MDGRELFDHLMLQLGLSDRSKQHELFQTAIVEKVIVHKKSRCWEFFIHFDQLLPVQIYQQFYQQLQLAFRAIADVRLHLSTNITSIQEISETQLQEYWEQVLRHPDCKTPTVQHALCHQTPFFEDGQVYFPVVYPSVEKAMANEMMPTIVSHYQEMGFPSFKIHLVRDEDKASKRQEALVEKTQESYHAMEEQAKLAVESAKKMAESTDEFDGPIQLGRPIQQDIPAISMVDVTEEAKNIILEGMIFDKEIRQLKSGRQLMILKVTDYTSSIVMKRFSGGKEDEQIFAALQKGNWIRTRGLVQEDNYSRELTFNINDLMLITHEERQDTTPENEKRVELHLHTTMSQMDAVSSPSELIAQAAKWGHKAVAITDHAAVQGFPEAYQAGKKNGVKILYGVEANIVDDGVPVVYNLQHVKLSDATYVVFDVETTGLSAVYDTIIELSAVKMYKGNVIDKFEEFIDPGHPLSKTTTELTGITDSMVRGSKSEEEVLKLFRQFSEGTILVAHNATFDMGFLNTGYRRHNIEEASNPVIDTLELSRLLYPTMKNHRLNTLAKKFKVNLEHHHRAIYDAEATGHLCWIFLKDAHEKYEMEYHDQLNDYVGDDNAYKQARPFHATIIAKNQAGLKNLFKLISLSNVQYFYRVARIPRSELQKYRDGLIVGSACSNGELFEAMMQKGADVAREKARFYDYIEIMPKPVYAPLLEQELVKNEQDLEDILQQLVKIGQELNIPVVATGDVHYVNPEDWIYRKILINSMGGANALNRYELPQVHFRTTNEMLDEFSFLGDELAHQVVIDNPNQVADWCEEVVPVKDKLYTPHIEGSDDEIRQLSYDKAHEIYGDPLPEIVEARLEKELTSIIKNGFSVIYLIAQKLVHKSLSDGYLVGSRGSVGSSFVATMSGITEVNPLCPHYVCPNCKHSEFFNHGEYGSGFDMPEKECPECGTMMKKDGHDIPFETFLGFHGDKVPDIDLNFSGSYQPEAHNYTKVLFGEDNVYRAGTIGTVADKTAFGYVKAYERDNNLQLRSAEEERLAQGATGVKRTTGQHPGGIVVIPDYMDVYDFTPIQYPADDLNAEWRTTHFDFHAIHDNILKLDILGHDDPTVIRMLQDLSGIDPKTIPADDPEVMKIFQGPEVLGVTPEQIFSKTGTLGIPEFGTQFVRGMLEQTKPTTFAELLQISGLSHGTDVWLGNAADLIENGTATLSECIGCRDDIMVYLIHHGLDNGLAFKIMESVRKGKGIPDEWQAEMRANDIPEWYIDSCLKIKYMFPKAHAAAYVLMALRVAYFKVHFPILYYCAYFSVRAQDFDLDAMVEGKDAVKDSMKEIRAKGNEASVKEKSILTVLELANEMIERGFSFQMVDLYKSDAENFIIEGDTLIAPFRAIPGLGDSVAKQIVAAREEGEFLSKEDLSSRGKVSKTLIEYMSEHGILDGMPEQNQLSLFDEL